MQGEKIANTHIGNIRNDRGDTATVLREIRDHKGVLLLTVC